MMENYITRYANEKGYSTRECYTPIRVQEVPDQFKHKYATYDESVSYTHLTLPTICSV